MRRGLITGLVLDRHSHDLSEYVKHAIGTIDKGSFMEALESAMHHLHAIGWTHNDLRPQNILVSQTGMPVLIDLGAFHKIGDKLTTSRGTSGWIDGAMDDHNTSEAQHDKSALHKIRKWLDEPTFVD